MKAIKKICPKCNKKQIFSSWNKSGMCDDCKKRKDKWKREMFIIKPF